MSKDDAINYFKEHREDLFDLCTELNLRFPYESRDEVMKKYKGVKSLISNAESKGITLGDDSALVKALHSLENTYHIFDPEPDEKWESVWLPPEYNEDANKILNFRKSMYYIQDIYKDKLFTELVGKDISYIWSEKGGQYNIFLSYPFTFSRRDIIHEYDYNNSEYESHEVYEVLRSYALDSSGGVVIFEERYTNTPKSDKYKGYNSSILHIHTLAEDDGFFFLNCSRIYEGVSGNIDDLNKLINMVMKEYETVFSKK